MGRKATGRTTKHVRVPIDEQELASFAITQIKETALPPLPLKVVRAFTLVALRQDLQIGSKARIMLEAELAVWKQIVLKRHGKFKARTKVIEAYGEELADLLFCVPPIHGTWWEVLGVTPNATPYQVKISYKNLCQEWHPDTNLRDALEATQVMQAINHAYEQYKQRVAKS